MDQIGNNCRCHCHSTFCGKPPHWKCYCECKSPTKNIKTPYKCPICDGKGGFYISGTMDEECSSCEKGIVWG